MMKVKRLALLVLLMVAHSHAAKILGLFPFPARSHLIVQKALMLELARRGHDVTILTHFQEKQPVPNLTEIYLETDFSTLNPENDGLPKNMFDMSQLGVVDMAMMMLMMGKPLCEAVLKEESVQKLIHAKDMHFDLVVIDAFVNDCMLGFAHKFNAPVIQVCSYVGTTFMANLAGNPNPYSYVPEELLNFRDEMTFTERLVNAVVGTLRQAGRYLIHIPAQDETIRKYFNYSSEPLPSVTELEKRTVMVLVNSHFSINYPKPLTPNYIQVGGMHVKSPKKLPEDLQKYMDNSPHGVIYFSMGSGLQSTQLPEEIRNIFLKTFSKLKQNVIWKWEADVLPGQPKNVKLGKWLPQSDILAHPNIRLFITHGGLLSTQEAVARGVPLVSIPVFADQYLNANRAVLAGYGDRLDFVNLTEEYLSQAINEVLSNPSYRENAQRLSRIFHDQPLTPLETAAFWTEYVIRHKGAPHMRSAALDLAWYQYYLVDVIFVLTAAISAVLLTVFFILRAFIRKCLVSSNKNIKVSSKKKRN